MIVLVETVHHVLTIDRAEGIVRYTRTKVPFTVDGLDAAFASVNAAFVHLDRSSLRLLVDMRAVPFYGDAALEVALRDRVGPLLDGFKRRATLVRTAVGLLQVNRITKDAQPTGGEQAVFRDETEALVWLTAG